MNKLTVITNGNILNIFIFTGIIISGWFLEMFIISPLIKMIVKKHNNNNDESRANAWLIIKKPIKIMIISFFVIIALINGLKINQYSHLFKTVIIIFLAYWFYTVIAFFGESPYDFKLISKSKIDNIVISFSCSILKAFIVMFAIGFIAIEWGYDVNGFVTGLGVLGLAIGLGAKDFLSNIFGGVAIAMDTPFTIGDWISTDEKIEGIVEAINFRSTKIRTFDKGIISIPNSLLANQPIYNWTRRDMRRVKFVTNVTHDISEIDMKNLIAKIIQIINEYELIDKETIIVAFDSYTQTSKDLLVSFFCATPEYKDYLEIKQNINFGILRIMEDENIKIALPAQKIFVTN